MANNNSVLQQTAEITQQLAETMATLNQSNATQMLADNALIDGTENYAYNQKIVNQIYAQTVAINNTNFTVQQTTQLYQIAQQCLSYGGPAIYDAQNIYGLINPQAVFSGQWCYNGSRMINEEAAENDFTTDFAVSLYPNPTNQSFNINVVNTNGIYAKIMDLQGRAFGNQIVLTSTDTNVDVSNWEKGFYIISFYDRQNKCLSSKKLIVY